jgi:hypothetical protein
MTEVTTSQQLAVYQPQTQPHDLLVVSQEMSFQQKAALLATYTQMKTIEGEAIDNFLGKTMRMTGLFQHLVPARKQRINRSTGEVIPAEDEWIRSVVFVQGSEKPFSLGSEPVAETVQDMIAVLGHGMFPQGESIPFHIDARGKGKGKYYVLVVESEEKVEE